MQYDAKSPSERLAENIDYRVESLRDMLLSGSFAGDGPAPGERRLQLIENRRKLFWGATRDSNSRSTRTERTEKVEVERVEVRERPRQEEQDDEEDLLPWERDGGIEPAESVEADVPTMSQAGKMR